MADVPLYPAGGTVTPSQLPGVRLSPTSPEDFGAAGARIQDRAAASLNDFANEQLMLQNQVRVNDAMNQARQKAQDLTYDPDNGYLAQRGRFALDRASGQPLPVEYGEKLGDAISQISSTLTPQQQRVFNMQAQSLQTSFGGQVQAHMLGESKSYAMSVANDALKGAGDEAGQVWNDDAKINGGVNPDTGQREGGLVQQAKAAVYASGRLTGMDVQSAMFEAGSSIHTKVIEAALDAQNPMYATKYLQAHSADMTSDDILKVQGRVNQNVDAQVAVLATNSAAAAVKTSFAPTDVDRLNALMDQQESKGHDFKPDGTPVVSPAGAMYAKQVMPETARNPGFGIKPADESGTPQQVAAEYNRVGTQLRAALLQKYGNVPQMLAAYNAGSGTVDKAIKDATDAGEPGLWLQAMAGHQSEANHAQTVNYVTSIMPKFETGGGAAPLPTKDEFVQSAIDNLGPNPRLSQVTLTRQQADARYTTLISSRNELADQALKAAQQALVANGGDMAALQRDQPDVIANVVRTNPGNYDNVLTFARNTARGENEDNLPAYGAAVTHPEEMAKMPDGAFDQFIKTNFSVKTGEKLYKLRAETINGATDDTAGAINNKALNDALHDRMGNLGIETDPRKLTSTSDKQRVGAVQQTLRDGIYSQQQQLGRKMTSEEVGKFVDAQFARGTVVKTWFGMGSETKPTLSMKIGDLDSSTVAQITQRLKNEGMAAPTNEDVMRRYFAVKNAQ